ncbi:pyruvate dehydrogenase (acetyl-transferring) E1 component subunit alpha [Emcibacter sp. SYSU 3D8]|uniref:pyruvate dehydrogenase (acetyl-transferring) E1 component subunit alpha n=1 Tax=Emcibacter sp. SYSU 3D8 TaxID=3133969 RepID=UPI0031FEA444
MKPETDIGTPDLDPRRYWPLLRYLDKAGAAIAPLPDGLDDRDILVSLYRAMVTTRTFDQKAVSLQRTGRLGTYASSLGQEAVSVGVGASMHKHDVLLPAFRDHGTMLWRGVTMTEILQYWSGDERGCDFAGPREDFPVAIPVASQATHAVGVAMAFQLRKEPRVAVCIVGDGATSKGDFYEAINACGVWKLPAVFVINNNQWAISEPTRMQTATPTLAQKAVAAGIAGSRVDGNDVVAVHDVVSRALDEARRGRPQLVEALTYRLGDHTTADDARRYRDDAEVSARWQEEPILRLRNYLVGRDWWGKADEEALIREVRAEVDRAAEAYLALPPQEPTAIFDYLHETLPPSLAGQRRMVEDGDG